MLQIGDMTLREEEVEHVEWRDGWLTLPLRWSFEELPVLFDLPEEVLLSWRAEDDPDAGIAAHLEGWRWTGGRLRMHLKLAIAQPT